MLFPLADGDLHHFLTSRPPPSAPSDVGDWLVEQMLAVCDALGYVHEHIVPRAEDGQPPTRRVGFHHDLKPANILLFPTSQRDRAAWKITDFGSGAVRHLSLDSAEVLYNRTPSTGDPVYSAPEYVVEGRVSQPKDVWSLGCIFFEALIWALTPEAGAVKRFRKTRDVYKRDNPDNAPAYWCQKVDGKPYVNFAVTEELAVAEARAQEETLYRPVIGLVKQMMAVEPEKRPTAAQLCKQFQALQHEARVGIDCYAGQ